jgi:hypothetical protein
MAEMATTVYGLTTTLRTAFQAHVLHSATSLSVTKGASSRFWAWSSGISVLDQFLKTPIGFDWLRRYGHGGSFTLDLVGIH